MKITGGYAYDAITETSLRKQHRANVRERILNNKLLAELAEQKRQTLHAKIARALDADWLSDSEICEEFNCAQNTVQEVREEMGQRKTRRWG